MEPAENILQTSVPSSPSHRALVGDTLDLLFRVLQPYVEAQMEAVYGDAWVREARGQLHGKPPPQWDVSDLFTLIYFRYAQAFRDMGHEGRSWVSILKEVRKRWAHQGELSVGETRRAIETALLVLRAVGAEDEAQRLEPHVLDLMQRELESRGVTPEPDAEAAGPDDAGAEEAGTNGGASWGLLGRGLRRLRRGAGRLPEEPLELRHRLLDEIERAAEPHRKSAGFNRIVVHVLAPEGRTRLLFEAALEGQDEPFPQAVHRRLAEARFSVPAQLHVGWRFYRRPPQRLDGYFYAQPFYVELHRRSASTLATLVVVQGRAKKERYTIRSGTTVTVGRHDDVTDDRGRVVRHNRVAFLDYADPQLDDALQRVHQTVSRAHAHIDFDEATGTFRLVDDQSTWGTSVVREGYPVPIQVKQQPVVLQDGDLLYFGKACVRFTLGRGRG